MMEEWIGLYLTVMSILACGAVPATGEYGPSGGLKMGAIAILWPIAVPVIGCYLLWRDR